jgi:hypothetical protein
VAGEALMAKRATTGMEFYRKKHKAKERFIEVVVWNDASFQPGQYEREQALTDCAAPVVTVGHYIGEAEGMVVLGRDNFDSVPDKGRVEEWRGLTRIPIENVVSRKRIKVTL